nr:unnamed protein product [Haemonchus contortus]
MQLCAVVQRVATQLTVNTMAVFILRRFYRHAASYPVISTGHSSDFGCSYSQLLSPKVILLNNLDVESSQYIRHLVESRQLSS